MSDSTITTAQKLAGMAMGVWSHNMNQPGLSPQARRAAAERAVKDRFPGDPRTKEPYTLAEYRAAFGILQQGRRAGQQINSNASDDGRNIIPIIGHYNPTAPYGTGSRGTLCYEIEWFYYDNGQLRRQRAVIRVDKYLNRDGIRQRLRYIREQFMRATERNSPNSVADARFTFPSRDSGEVEFNVLNAVNCYE